MRRLEFTGQRVVVLGLGLHGGGVAVAKWLVKHGATVTVTDIKSRAALAASLKQLKGLPIKYVFGRHPLSLLHDCDLVIQNPGVPSDHPFLKAAKQGQIAIENEASLFLKLCPSDKVVAVTGTRGKSTVVSLLGLMMKRAWPATVVAGNIRDTVLFGALDKITASTHLAIELSSWQLEGVGQYKLRVPVAVVTNVLPDHLNRYDAFASYVRAKAMIFTGQHKTDAVVLNYDNSVTRQLARLVRSKIFWFSLRPTVGRGCFVRQGAVYWRDRGQVELLFYRRDLELLGAHNFANALAAAATARLLGVKPSAIRAAVKEFKGLHDRLEYVGMVSQVPYYNDTASTSPDATMAALHSFADKAIILIAGGTDKSLSYYKMAQAIRQRAAAVVLLPGTATAKLQRALRGYKKILLARSMLEAVRLARRLTLPGSVVLLSPGAASFGLFRHEFDRGEAFKQAVVALGKR